MKDNVKPLPRIRNKEDICENCVHCFVGQVRGSLEIHAQKILECHYEPPTNVFTKDGIVIQPKMTLPGYFCSRFEK